MGKGFCHFPFIINWNSTVNKISLPPKPNYSGHLLLKHFWFCSYGIYTYIYIYVAEEASEEGKEGKY